MSESIILKHWKKLDADQDGDLLLKWFTDPEVMKYMGFYKKCKGFTTPEEAKDFSAQLEGGMFFGIYTQEGKLIGQTTFSHFIGDECEFGILIGEKEFWGKGVGTEVTKGMIGYGFDSLKINRITLTTASKNIAGQKVYLKAGFNIDEIKKNDRLVYLNGEFTPDDTLIMSIHKNNPMT